jgi:hypothetical protein
MNEFLWTHPLLGTILVMSVAALPVIALSILFSNSRTSPWRPFSEIPVLIFEIKDRAAWKKMIRLTNGPASFDDMKRAFHFAAGVGRWKRTHKVRSFGNWWLHCRAKASKSMGALAKSDRISSTERDELATLMRRAIDDVVGGHIPSEDEACIEVLDTIAAVSPTWEENLLEGVASASIEPRVRGHALKRIAHLRGISALPLIMLFFADAAMSPHVTAALRRLGRAAATPDVLQYLRRLLAETTDTWAASGAAGVLIGFGKADDPALIGHLEKLPAWTRFAVRAKAAGLDAPDLIERFCTAGIIDETRRAKISPSMVNWMRRRLNEGDGFGAVVTLLERLKAVWSFDGEQGEPPVYGTLLQELRKTWPEWPLTDPVIRMDPSDLDFCHQVSLKISDLPVTFFPKKMDDWVDVNGMIAAFNQAFETHDQSNRFGVLLGDLNHVVMYDVSGIQPLLALDLPLLEADPARPAEL